MKVSLSAKDSVSLLRLGMRFAQYVSIPIPSKSLATGYSGLPADGCESLSSETAMSIEC